MSITHQIALTKLTGLFRGSTPIIVHRPDTGPVALRHFVSMLAWL